MSRRDTVRILGINLDVISKSQLEEQTLRLAKEGFRQTILNINAHALNIACELPGYADYFNQADIVFADGNAARLGALLKGVWIPDRITYADWIWDLAKIAQDNELTMFLLGARQGVAEAAAEQLQKRYPNLHIGGVHHGYFNKNLDHPSNTQVVSEINSVSPAILLVGFGMPTQEQWLKENLEFLNVNVVLSCGAAFDYASGRLPRPPKFMRVLGLEWLGRLLIEPRRLGRRYAIGIPKILVRLVLDAIRPVGSEVGKA